jgi:hypothetical protein
VSDLDETIVTTPDLLRLVGMTRANLQQFENSGAVVPHVRGGSGRRNCHKWTFLQLVGLAYGKAFLDCGFHCTWAWEACDWVSRQEPGSLVVQFAKGRTLLCMSPGRAGQGRLIEPKLGMDAPREKQVMAANLNLKTIYERMWRRARAWCGDLLAQEAENE